MHHVLDTNGYAFGRINKKMVRFLMGPILLATDGSLSFRRLFWVAYRRTLQEKIMHGNVKYSSLDLLKDNCKQLFQYSHIFLKRLRLCPSKEPPVALRIFIFPSGRRSMERDANRRKFCLGYWHTFLVITPCFGCRRTGLEYIHINWETLNAYPCRRILIWLWSTIGHTQWVLGSVSERFVRD